MAWMGVYLLLTHYSYDQNPVPAIPTHGAPSTKFIWTKIAMWNLRISTPILSSIFGTMWTSESTIWTVLAFCDFFSIWNIILVYVRYLTIIGIKLTKNGCYTLIRDLGMYRFIGVTRRDDASRGCGWTNWDPFCFMYVWSRLQHHIQYSLSDEGPRLYHGYDTWPIGLRNLLRKFYSISPAYALLI